MKILFKITALILLIILCSNIRTEAQIPENVKSYAVIGVYGLEKNAKRVSEYYKEHGLDSKIKMNLFNNMYYVYVLETEDVEEARSKVLSIRKDYTTLSKTWLYNGNFNCIHIPSDQLKSKKAETERKSQELAQINTNEEAVASEMEPEPEPVKVKEPKVNKPDGIFWVYFNTYNINNLDEVSGNVTVFDDERNKEIGVEKAHELISMKSPKNGTNKVKFASDIFGYKPVTRQIDLDEPLTEDTKSFISLIGDSIVVDFPLSRFQNGDFMTMWNVYFYIDAAIMKEESVEELMQLLDMMREDESIRIKIHGHTNGNSHGTVKHLDLDDRKFFSLNGSHLEDKASAKKLSLFRAHTIKYWLMDQGIAEDRMDIVGWGGKKMLYDKHSANAEKNVRVEIEIL